MFLGHNVIDVLRHYKNRNDEHSGIYFLFKFGKLFDEAGEITSTPLFLALCVVHLECGPALLPFV